MSKLFFDHLLTLDRLEIVIKKSATTAEEREELWALVDEIISHKVIEKVLNKLPKESHVEFLELFHKCPYDEVLIFEFLRSKTHKEIEKELREELKDLPLDILKELALPDETSVETKVSKK